MTAPLSGISQTDTGWITLPSKALASIALELHQRDSLAAQAQVSRELLRAMDTLINVQGLQIEDLKRIHTLHEMQTKLHLRQIDLLDAQITRQKFWLRLSTYSNVALGAALLVLLL
jgi:hypothetical protein